MRRWMFLIVLALLAAGCLSPVKQLGCCLREEANETGKCLLYDTTDFTEHPEYMDKTIWCNTTSGHCNVSIFDEQLQKDVYHLIPVCTEDQIVPCIEPDCAAMVCGDFKYRPRVAPAFTSASDSAGDVPPQVEAGAAMNFYKAQCRFINMDARLRQIMKNSQSSMNVFRMGVGSSFDEFDQYRYYFPMSDKFCNLNPSVMGEEKIDRFMNYLQSDGTDFDPGEIEENCFDEGDVKGPFNFQESSATRHSTGFGYYTPVVPDAHNYKFAHYGRIDFWAYWTPGDDDGGFYYYTTPYINQFSVHKNIDKTYYRKQLSIAHVDTIYDLDDTGVTRAPFECDIKGSECYSADCNINVYNRGVLLEEGGEAMNASEVVADCNKETDEFGKTVVVCAPTKSVTPQGPNVPKREFAKTNIHLGRMTMDMGWGHLHSEFTNEDGVYMRPTLIDPYWNNFMGYGNLVGWDSGADALEYMRDNMWFSWVRHKDCHGGESETMIWCPHYGSTSVMPPYGGALFFGRFGTEDEPIFVKWGDNPEEVVIGYALATDTEFKDTLLAKNCNLKSGVDYEYVNIERPDGTNWQPLMNAFKPYYDYRADSIIGGGFEDGCGERINPPDIVISSIPWITYYEKGFIADSLFGDHQWKYMNSHLNSKIAQELRQRNTYSETMIGVAGTNSCELRRDTVFYEEWWGEGVIPAYYDFAASKGIYLLKYTKGSGVIGDCAVDDKSFLPEVRTYGWCEPCTTSTLAYQAIDAHSRVYMPGISYRIQESDAREGRLMCVATYNSEWELFEHYVEDRVACTDPAIPDLSDYGGSIGGIGSPRTSPEASVMKERMGNYMRSGIMPVIDMSAQGNWAIDNPDKDVSGFNLFWWQDDYGSPQQYMEYDFQRLLGTMGASVVIVKHVNEGTAGGSVGDIITKAELVKQRCYGCLTAFHVDNPASNESFENTVQAIMGDPGAQFAVDMITFDYSVSDKGFTEPEEVVENLETYGRISLTTPVAGVGKPVMVVGFNVDSDDGTWDDTNYWKLFNTIVDSQQDLITAGVTGIIYSPARDGGSDEGLVDIVGSVGTKNEKFCAFQGAMQRMSQAPPTALFTRIPALENVTCVKCMSIEMLPGGVCEPGSGDATKCDNGAECTLPEGVLDETGYKCPANTVVHGDTGECPLCEDVPGSFSCIKTFVNGTEVSFGEPMSVIDSDLYLDVIGALPKPDKCCLEEETGIRYSFYKQSFEAAINKPLVFPRSGDPDVDCGMGDPSDIGELTTFCNLEEMPLKEYDIECEIS